MAVTCTCQLARQADAGTIARLSAAIIEAGLRPTWGVERVLWHIRDGDSVVLTAKEAASLVGFAIMKFDESRAHLNLLGVVPARQRSGIGTRMVRWLEASAMVAGTFLVDLEVRATNHCARKFYERLGFRQSGLVQGYYQGIDDAIRMQHDLRVSADEK